MVVIDDKGTVKSGEATNLSPEGKLLATRVQQAHCRWLEIAGWGRTALTSSTVLPPKEGLAVMAYEDLRKKLPWPLWATTMDDAAIQARIFAIQATWSRMQRLVPEAFAKPADLLSPPSA